MATMILHMNKIKASQFYSQPFSEWITEHVCSFTRTWPLHWADQLVWWSAVWCSECCGKVWRGEYWPEGKAGLYSHLHYLSPTLFLEVFSSSTWPIHAVFLPYFSSLASSVIYCTSTFCIFLYSWKISVFLASVLIYFFVTWPHSISFITVPLLRFFIATSALLVPFLHSTWKNTYHKQNIYLPTVNHSCLLCCHKFALHRSLGVK